MMKNFSLILGLLVTVFLSVKIGFIPALSIVVLVGGVLNTLFFSNKHSEVQASTKAGEVSDDRQFLELVDAAIQIKQEQVVNPERSLEELPINYKLEMLEKAAKLEKSGNWKKMLTFCEEWTSAEPQNQFAWQGLGDSLRKLGNPAEAITMYRKGLEVAPLLPVDFMWGKLSAAPLWYRLGNAFSELGDRQKAIEAFLEATRIDPDVADIWNDLGVVYINMDPIDAKAAFESFKKAISVDPKNINSLKNLGSVYAMCGSEQGVNQVYLMLSELNKREADNFLKQTQAQ
jgi:tetratricopeptide (TPR) repeat protein